ncbi:MAG: tRNA pseudouridine(38-40) synthase TruA [Phycisphaerae bacterium]
MSIRNIKLTIAYDGSEYHGWQIQPERRTVQGELVNAISELIGWKVRVCGASRTDAGVSAVGQVALIQIDSPIPTENLAKAINDRLPRDIAVREAVEIPLGFDIIGAVKSKLYRYSIYTGKVPPVLQIRHCWHLPAKLDIAAMTEAAKMLIGTMDFKSFASAADKREISVRTILRCDVTSESEWVYFDVEGDSFLYNMVRNIVGTLVEVGIGRWRPDKISEILQARNRTAAGPIAPAAGLCLMRIEY